MKEFRSNVGLLARVFLKRYFLFVLNGFLLAASLFFYMHDRYEHEIVHALSKTIQNEYGQYRSEDSLLVASVRLTHYLEERRHNIFGNEDINDGYSDFLRPLTYDLMTAKGACGSYSLVLGSILEDLGFTVRFAQMKVNGIFGGHIIIEAKTKKGWAVLDPSFNLYFRKANGDLASFQDVKANWQYYKTLVPVGYRPEYAYQDVRYTNWGKIPVLSPIIKGSLNLMVGKENADNISVRGLFLRKFLILFYIAFAAYVYSWYRIFKRYLRTRGANVDTTSSNIKSGNKKVYKVA